mgnify:CR=1 FL=1
MRILHVTPYAADAWAYGGIPRVAHSLARSLVRRGHDVTVCTTDVCDEVRRLPAGFRRTADGIDLRVFRNVSNGLAYRHQLFLPRGLGAWLAQGGGRGESDAEPRERHEVGVEVPHEEGEPGELGDRPGKRPRAVPPEEVRQDRKSTRLNSSHRT